MTEFVYLLPGKEFISKIEDSLTLLIQGVLNYFFGLSL